MSKFITDGSTSAAAPPPLLEEEFWDGIKNTLMGDEINEEKAEMIVTLLQKSYNQRILNTIDEITGVTDQLKLLSLSTEDIRALDTQLEIIAQRLNIPTVGISLTEQKVKKWRIIITYLFGAGLSMAAINAIVPIKFGLIANTVFAGGLEAAKVFLRSLAGPGANMTPEAIQNATAAANASRGMVAGPSMDAVKALGGTIGKNLGSVIYTLSALALTKCVTLVTAAASGASTAASAACQLLSTENAGRVADLAVLSATVKGITVGIDKGWDFVRDLNNGNYDAAIATIIDQGPVDSAENAMINNILESVYNIEASKFGIKMNTGIPDRDLDTSAERMIKGHFDQALEAVEKNIPANYKLNKTNKRIANMSELSALDVEVPNPVDVKRLIQQYGMAVVVLYMLLINKSPPAKSGLGSNKHSSSQPDADMFASTNLVKMQPSSYSMPANREEPTGHNPLFVKYELKKQILKEAGYPDSNPIFRGYILDFIGEMHPIVVRVLSKPMYPYLPGNLYTAIAENNLNPVEQQSIRNVIMEKVNEDPVGWEDDDDDDEKPNRGEGWVNELAVKVRRMILRQPVVAAATLKPSVPIFEQVKKGITGKPRSQPYEAFGEDWVGSRQAILQAQEQEAALAAETKILGKRQSRLGGRSRKSKRYKKRRSTLKRRRMKRRRTRKGKKRRHTKKRR